MSKQSPNPIADHIGTATAACIWPLVICATALNGYPAIGKRRAMGRETKRWAVLLIISPFALVSLVCLLIATACELILRTDRLPDQGCGPYGS